MNLLIIDSSTRISSAALLANNEIYSICDIDEQSSNASENLLLNINKLLQEANLDLKNLSAICFSAGPGSFTGVRIAVSVAQGLALGADLPLISITSLDLIAEETYEKYKQNKVLAALDARKGEIYCGLFELNKKSNLMELVGDIELQKNNGKHEFLTPNAKYGINLARFKYANKEFVELEKAEPLYIRNNIV